MNMQSKSPALERWYQLFDKDAIAAIGGLLEGRYNLGPYNRARAADALLQLLADEKHALADTVLLAWLEHHLGKGAPEGLSNKRFADALVEAFRAITLIPLPITRKWVAKHQGSLRNWLRGLLFWP